MENWFDRLSKALGKGISRRESMRYIGASAIGAAMLGFGSKKAEAKAVCNKGDELDFCADGGSLGCYCFVRTQSARLLCGQDDYCVNLTACESDSDCTAAGLSGQWRCSDTPGCGGVCIARCGVTPTVTSPSTEGPRASGR